MKSETKLLLVMGAIVALGAIFLTFNKDKGIDTPPVPSTPAPMTNEHFEEIVKGTKHFKGDPKARFTVIEFADFQCPSCRHAYDIGVKDLGTKLKDVYFGFRHFPIDRIHPFAMPASLMSEVAERQGKFWDAYEALMKDPKKEINEAAIEAAAKAINLDMERYKKEKTEPALIKQIAAERDEGREKFQVNETPTFFVRDRQNQRIRMVTGYSQLYNELRSIPGMPTPEPSNATPAPPPQ